MASIEMFWLQVRTTLSGMVTSALVTPLTRLSADRTRILQLNPHRMPETLRWRGWVFASLVCAFFALWEDGLAWTREMVVRLKSPMEKINK